MKKDAETTFAPEAHPLGTAVWEGFIVLLWVTLTMLFGRVGGVCDVIV